MRNRIVGAALISVFWGAATSGTAQAMDPLLTCEKLAGKSLVKCAKKVTALQRNCFRKTGVACLDSDELVVKALGKLASKVSDKCTNDATVQQVGFGPTTTLSGVISRLQSVCLADARSLAARVYGGPHGQILDDLDEGTSGDAGRKCLDTAFKQGRKVLFKNAKTLMGCVDKQRKSGNCDVAKIDAKIQKTETKAAEKIDQACTATPLSSLSPLTTAQFLERTAAQSRCMAAIAHPDVTPLELDCGPRSQIADPVRGTYTQIVLDGDEFGTRCGDGSDFAFWVRLAPQGHPVENIVLQMQGGGVCIFEAQCGNGTGGRFEALSDNPPTTGIMSNDELVSPFANWTKVYFPYCTQDVFIGGGVTNVFSPGTPNEFSVERYGAVNVRTALRYVRDMIWRELDDSTNEGYNPDRIRMLFGGTSAGGFGTLYNYHYVLDDLQWTHTSAWPDAALALNNPNGLGISALGAILLAPTGWNAASLLPPYCQIGGCAVGPTLYAASAPRLKGTPEQQFLILSNQVDSTQVNTTFLTNGTTVAWINEMRTQYCNTQGLNGIRYFLPAISTSTHVIATRENLYTTQAVDGTIMRDWLEGAITDPDDVDDKVEEGTLTVDYPGVNAFSCLTP